MRKVLPFTVLIASLLVSACSDTNPTAGPDLKGTAGFARSRNGAVDNLIMTYFPRGLETATGTRFDHIDAKLGEWLGTMWSGDVAVARTQLAELVTFVSNKQQEIDALALQPGESQAGAAARLVLAMSTYVNAGPVATPPQPPAGAVDLTFEYVPAGSAALIQTPSGRAGLRLDAGSTGEDRVILISRNLFENTEGWARCAGPLTTDRCQYPYFYKFESYPLLRLQNPGRFAVCHVASEVGPTETEDGYIRLAHNLPEDPNNYTAGAIQEGQIEILPRADVQTGVVNCSETATTASGILGAGQRALYALADFAAKVIGPKALQAYDQGPEHYGDFFSDFVGVGAPNYVGNWNGTTTFLGASGGQPVTVVINSQSDAGVTGEYRVALGGEGPFTAYNIREGDGLGRFISSSTVGFSSLDVTIDPFFSPFSAGVKVDHTFTWSVNTDGIGQLNGTTTRHLLIGGVPSSDTWTTTLTRATEALVGLPCTICVDLRATPAGTMASSTSETPIQ